MSQPEPLEYRLILASKHLSVLHEILKIVKSENFDSLLSHVEIRTKGEPYTMMFLVNQGAK